MASINTIKRKTGTVYQIVATLPAGKDHNGKYRYERYTTVMENKTAATNAKLRVEAVIDNLKIIGKDITPDNIRLVMGFVSLHEELLLGKVFEALQPREPEAGPHEGGSTFGEYGLNGYQVWRIANEVARDQKNRARQVKWWIAALGKDTRMDEVPQSTITRELNRYAAGKALSGPNRGKKRSLQSRDRLLACISSIFGAAVDDGILGASKNPTLGLKARAKSRGNSERIGQFLGADERDALLAAARKSKWERMYLNILIALRTGGRQGEISWLRWEDIDFSNREIEFVVTKSNRRRKIKVGGDVIEELLKFRQKSGLIFPGVRSSEKPFAYRNHWEKALKDAGIKCRYHDLRHTAASIIVNGGIKIHTAKRILGHSTIKVTEIYLHDADDSDDDFAALMEAQVKKL